MKPEKAFRKVVLNSIDYAFKLLASEGLRYPNAVITGGAAILLGEPHLKDVYSTGDVDLLLEFHADVDEIFLTLTDLERKHPGEIFVIATVGVVELAPLKKKNVLPIDFVGPVEPRIQKLFKYTSRNANAVLGTLKIRSQPVVVYVARLEDAILCKLAVRRKKDIEGLKQIVPRLERLERLDWKYLQKLADKFNLGKELKLLKKLSQSTSSG
jgi:hypothetical protein